MARINLPEIDKPRIVIIGAGFAGLVLAKKLAKSNFQIVLLDRNNFHQFQPLFYQVAMSGLEPSAICFPLRKVFQNSKNVFIRVCEVQSILPESKQIQTDNGLVNYDYLVLAMGAKNSYFGNTVLEEKTLSLKSVAEAIAMRNQILSDYENSLLEHDINKRQELLDIVIVGAGPTGVELAGALAELRNHVLPKDYPELDLKEMDIHLVQSRERILDGMNPNLCDKALNDLKNLGVQVHLKKRVVDIQDNQVILSTGEKLIAKKVIWAAGVTAATIPGFDETVIHSSKRYIVDSYLRLKSYQDIYALGDVAFIEEQGGHPQVAPVAIQQANYLARCFKSSDFNNKLPSKKFEYFDKGSMATIGRHKAVAEFKKLKFTGVFAWFMWLFVHIYFLIGLKNKIIVLFNWVWAYLFFDQGLRLLIKPKIKGN